MYPEQVRILEPSRRCFGGYEARALTVGEAFGPTLNEVILAALSRSQRPLAPRSAGVLRQPCGGSARRPRCSVAQLADLWRVRKLAWRTASRSASSAGHVPGVTRSISALACHNGG